MISPGTLCLLVGPSGVGKDTLLDGVRAHFRGRGTHVFPLRHITRPASAGGEQHHSVTEEAFRVTEAAGGYALSWRAHGLSYGIPVSVLQDLLNGRQVVVNASRRVVAQARRSFPRVQIIQISAPVDVLRARLERRGRENGDDIEARIARAQQFQVTGDDVVDISNDGSPETGIRRLVTVLQNVSEIALEEGFRI